MPLESGMDTENSQQSTGKLASYLTAIIYWLKNSENSVHKLRLYATVLLTIYKISRQLFQTTKVRSAKHQFRIIKIHTWLHLHTPLSALNELLA